MNGLVFGCMASIVRKSRYQVTWVTWVPEVLFLRPLFAAFTFEDWTLMSFCLSQGFFSHIGAPRLSCAFDLLQACATSSICQELGCVCPRRGGQFL